MEARRSPRRAIRDQDERDLEDKDDRPRRRQRQKKSALPWVLAGVAGGVLVLLIVIIALIMGEPGAANPEAVAQNNQPQFVLPVNENPNVPQIDQPVENKQPAVPAVVEPLPKRVEIPAGPTPGQIEPESTKKVKNATAYLRVQFGNGKEAQGSGFFAEERGLVFTNAHVLGMLKSSSAPPTKVDVVIHSGEKEEFTRQGRVLAVDRDSDLGVLRIDDTKGLPDPLPVDTTRTLTELQEVYVFGFPFGNSLGKNITVSKSSVSSLRKDADGTVYQVQVNGGMNPGNSGGPVVDARGVVIGVAVAIIEGTQINFAVPGEKVQALLRGRVASLSLGDSYLSDARVKLPIEVSLLDPLGRLQDVKIEVWAGNHGPARPLSLQPPTPLPGDGVRQTRTLVCQNSKAVTEIELPALQGGQAFWIQPVLTDRAGVRQWGTATAYKASDYAPLVGKPVTLKYQFENQTERTVKFGNFYKDLLTTTGGKQVTVGVNLEIEAVETSQKDPRGGQSRLFLANSQLALDVDGKITPKTPQVLSLFRGKSLTYVSDVAGGLLSRSIPKLNPPNPMNLRSDFEDWAMQISNGYEMTLISLPNREVQPKETWEAKVPFFHSTLGKKKEVADMHLKCTLGGSRLVQGQNQAVISLAGTIRKRGPGQNISSGKVTGKVYFANDQGYVAQAKLKIESDVGGDDRDSHFMEISLTRSPGNTTGVTPTPAPAATPPTQVAKKPLPRDPNPVNRNPAPVEPMPRANGAGPEWTLDLAKMKFPDGPAAGSILGQEFKVEAVKFDAGGALTLRQGQGFLPDASMVIFLGLKPGEGLAGKTFEIGPDLPLGAHQPAIHLRRLMPGNKIPTGTAFGRGFAMKLELGDANNGMIPGKIYVCLPDNTRTVVAGTFVLNLN